MNPVRAMIVSAFVSLAAVAPALAQGPCDLVVKQAVQVLGAPAGQPERIKPAANTEVCSVRSADRAAEVWVTITAVGKGGLPLATAKMIATMSKEPGQTVKDEQGLGRDAFSMREKESVVLMFADTAREFTLRFTRDRGVTDADAERARQLAKQLLAAK
jgi:hypothetical protein